LKGLLMQIIADALLVSGALGAGTYCYILSRRLSRFNDLETGIGGAVAVLSAQVDDLTRALAASQLTAASYTAKLESVTERAETVARQLEIMLASLHDLPDSSARPTAETVPDPEPDGKSRTEPMFKRHRRDEYVSAE